MTLNPSLRQQVSQGDASLKGAKPLNTEHTSTEAKKQEIKNTLVALTNYLERLEKYLKSKYDSIDAKQTNDNTNNSNNSSDSSL